MHTVTAYGQSQLHYWQHVREFAVPPSMIESATTRRTAGDWAGACAAARVDLDLDLRAVARAHGRDLADLVRTDLRRLAPDLLRWHLPRIAPDGLLRPGLTVSLASYRPDGPAGDTVHLVVRTPPTWADAGQRVSLALWHASTSAAGSHPHPRPDRRFRLDLHRHLWDAHRAGDLRDRAGATPGDARARELDPDRLVPPGAGCAVDRWAGEAAILLRSEGLDGGTVTVRLGVRRRLSLHVGDPHPPHVTAAPARGEAEVLPMLPHAATWVLPDLALLRAGLIEAERLHPLVAAALVPDSPPAGAHRAEAGTGQRLVECRGIRHRIGLVDGVLVPLDHGPAELHREELLTALGGPPLPCLRAIDEASRRPECLPDVRARLIHGDAAGALAAVVALLGPEALLRDGALRDELVLAAQRQVTHGLYRAGLADTGPFRLAPEHRRRGPRPNQRRASSR